VAELVAGARPPPGHARCPPPRGRPGPGAAECPDQALPRGHLVRKAIPSSDRPAFSGKTRTAPVGMTTPIPSLAPDALAVGQMCRKAGRNPGGRVKTKEAPPPVMTPSRCTTPYGSL